MADVVSFLDHLPKGAAISEEQIAAQFVLEHADRLLYCHARKQWFSFDGSLWRAQKLSEATWYARQVTTRYSQRAKNQTAMETQKFISAVEKLSTCDPRISRTAEDWDADPWIMGTPKGTVDLKTGALRPSDPVDMITRSAGAVPSDKARCPRWLNFLHETTGGDQDMVDYLQRVCGYCLTGVTSEQCFFFIFGDGGNGKGTFVKILSKIMGAYWEKSSIEAFTEAKTATSSAGASPAIAKLAGARLVTASETKAGVPWAEARIKELTGGDPISARFLHRNEFTFEPLFKLIVIGNHQPTLENLDEAMRRRLNMIPFTRKPDVRDTELDEKLMEELPGIFRWMIDGCVQWRSTGLKRPSAVTSATEAYFDDQNTFEAWLDECCDVDRGNPHFQVSSAKAYASWAAYAKALGEHPGSNRTLSQTLVKNGFKRHRTKKEKLFLGLAIKQPKELYDF